MSKELDLFSKKYKKILVTGGAGAIGSNIVKRLLEGDVEKIIIIDNLSSGVLSNIPKDKRVIFIKGDIAKAKILSKAFSHDVDMVFHLAANFANQNSVDNPIRDLISNGLGSVNLLEFTVKHKVKKFIYFSTSCLYRSKNTKLKESDLDLQFETPYAISKYMAERYAFFYGYFHHLPVVVLRIFNSFGPGELPGKYRNVIPNFMERGIKNQPLVITGTGKETRNFTFVSDIVRGALLAAMSDRANGKIVNLGHSKQVKILELAQAIIQITGNKQEIIFQPRRKWDNSLRRDGNVSLANALFGFKAKVSLEDGLKEVHSWMLDKIESKNA